MKTFAFYSFTLILVCLIYGKTIYYQYNLDDKLATSINPMVKKGFQGIPEILKSPYLGKHEPRYGGYRPLTRITFAIEYAIFGENTTINHIINLLIYFLSCILFFHLIRYIFPNWTLWIAALATLIFVCHPLHVEVVSSLKNREVLLSFFFGIASVLVLVRKVNWVTIGISIILFFLAAFSKLDAVFFPVFTAFLFYIKDKWKAWQSISYGLFLPIAAVIIYFLVQSQFPEPIILDIQYAENPLVGHQFTVNHFATVAYILAYNLRLLFIPNQFLFFYGAGPVVLMSWVNAIVILSALVHLFLLGMMVYGVKNKKHYALIIIFYFFSIGLYMNLVQLIPGVIGDRFLYTTVGALALFFGYIANYLMHRTQEKIAKIICCITGVIFCFYMSITAYNRVDCWENPVTLGNCDIDQLDNALTAQIIYLRFLDTELKKAKPYFEKNYLIKKSIEHGYKALEMAPNNFNAKNHLGYVFCSELDSIKLGGQLLFEAMKIVPNNPQLLYNLGLCFEKKGEIQNATKFYEAALTNETNNVTLKSKLVMTYCASGKLKEAEKEVRDLVTNYAYDYKSFISEGTYYLFLKDTLKATQSFEKALDIKPNLTRLKKQVLEYYSSKGNFQKVEFYSR